MAGKIPRHFIDDLLRRVDIVDVVQRRVKLKNKGSNYSACCPFHSEKTPSFTVSQPKQFYHCFGCGAHGNAISFLMEYDGMHFVEAIEDLASSLGLEVPRETSANPEKERQERKHAQSLYDLMRSCADYYRRALHESDKARSYLEQRGLTAEAVTHYELGYAPDGWDTLLRLLPNAQPGLLESGMLTQNERQRVYDRFRDRLMFPIKDRRGRIIAFGGRIIDDGQPKYLNSPETPLFQKSNELYGLHECRREAQALGQVVVVEGYMDVVSLSCHGVNNAVATLGTAPNTRHVETLFKLVPEIVFCFDGDNAGRAAAWRALSATLPALMDGKDAWFLFLPDGKDPDNLVKEGGNEAFQAALQQRMSLLDFLFTHLLGNGSLDDIGTRARLAKEARPLIAQLPPGVYRRLAIQRLEQQIGLSLELGDARTAGNRVGGGAQSNHQRHSQRQQRQGPSAMRRVMTLLIQNPWLVRTLAPEQMDFDPALRGGELLTRIITLCEHDPDIPVGALTEHFRETADWKIVDRLSVAPYLPDGKTMTEEEITAEFAEVMAQLAKQKTDLEVMKVPPSSRTGLLALRKGTAGTQPQGSPAQVPFDQRGSDD